MTCARRVEALVAARLLGPQSVIFTGKERKDPLADDDTLFQVE